MDLWSFVKEYYIDSIVYKEGYNVVNTLTWAAILLIAIVLLYRFLSKRLNFDSRFFIAMLPFVIFGSSLRIVEDAGFVKPPISYFLMTPFIYILTFAVAFPMLLLSLRTKNYHRVCFAVGAAMSAAVLAFLLANLEVENPWVLPLSSASAFALSMLYFATTRSSLNSAVVFAHMLDGFSSYIGVKFLGYWELHVLPRFLIENFGAEVLPVAKLAAIIVVLYAIDRGGDEENFKNFLKFALLVLGLAPGIRNSLRMTFGV
ncbi:MAG: DUF63 family protein [Archaeoglobaceae archaeon]